MTPLRFVLYYLLIGSSHRLLMRASWGLNTHNITELTVHIAQCTVLYSILLYSILFSVNLCVRYCEYAVTTKSKPIIGHMKIKILKDKSQFPHFNDFALIIWKINSGWQLQHGVWGKEPFTVWFDFPQFLKTMLNIDITSTRKALNTFSIWKNVWKKIALIFLYPVISL